MRYRKTRLYSKILLILVLSIFFSANIALAGSLNLDDAFDGGPLDDAAGTAGYDTTTYKIEDIVGIIIQAVLSLLGVVFLILMVYGGYLWMTARGEEQLVTKAKDTIRMAIIGLCIVIAAYAISIFVISKFTAGTLITPPAQ